MPSYSELMLETDGQDLNRSYIARKKTSASCRTSKKKNLVVPLVGDFAGSKAIRAVAQYLKEHEHP